MQLFFIIIYAIILHNSIVALNTDNGQVLKQTKLFELATRSHYPKFSIYKKKNQPEKLQLALSKPHNCVQYKHMIKERNKHQL